MAKKVFGFQVAFTLRGPSSMHSSVMSHHACGTHVMHQDASANQNDRDNMYRNKLFSGGFSALHIFFRKIKSLRFKNLQLKDLL